MSFVIAIVCIYAGLRILHGDPSRRSSSRKRIVPFSKDAWGWLNGREETIPPGTAKKRR